MSSDPPASTVAPLESRLTELEIKAAFTEDLLDDLNLLVYRQQEQIDRLVRELHQLRRQMPEDRAADGAGGANGIDPRNELPPHY